MKRLFNDIGQNKQEMLQKQIKIIRKEYLRGDKINTSFLVSHLIFIKRGSLRQNNYIYSMNDIIGLSSIFSSSPFYEGNIYAETLTSVDLITKEDVLFLINSDHKIMLNLLQLISDEFKKNQTHLLMLSHIEYDKRLLHYFYNEYKLNNATTFLINYKKKELAQYLLIDAKSFTVELNKLIKSNIISNQNKLYTILDIDLVEKIIQK
ncbi:MAG: Crp/Fnr family transcriptional regulator [Acholeplasmatales bacterium]|nr:Crp/Fnr family transcriptional regulator [Acholeplasmatales bacterium]